MRAISSRTVVQAAAIGVLFVAVLLVMLRPTASSLENTLPANLGDPALVAWTLAWDAHALVDQPGHVFDANIYWPNPDTLAYSDNLLALSPLSAPIWALSSNAVLTLNVTMLALLLLSLAATYALTRWLTDRIDAAVLAAVAFTFSGYTMAHLGHPQLLTLGFFPLGFLVVFAAIEQRRTWAAVAWGLVNVVFVLGALYYAMSWALCSAMVVVGYLIARRLRPGPGFVRMLAVAGVISLLAVPAVLPYLELDQQRPLRPDYGLNPADLISPAPGTLVYDDLAEAADERAFERIEHAFFPGFLVFALAAVGVGALARSFRSQSPTNSGLKRRTYLILLLAAGLATGVVALGPDVLGQPGPFRLLRRAVPGFDAIRVAARLAVPALLAGAVLAGLGLATLVRRLRPPVGTVVAAVAVALVLVELSITLVRPVLPEGREQLEVYDALEARPAGAVVELPMGDPREGAGAWAYLEAPRMLYATRDWHPRVNGYSGNYPPEYLDDIDTLDRFPAPAARARLAELDVRYVVLHTGWANGFPQMSKAEAMEIVRSLPPGVETTRVGDAWLLDLGERRLDR